MLPRLEAEERLKAITDLGVGTGSMERRDQKDVLTALKRAALVEVQRPRKASRASLIAMGIGVSSPAAKLDRGASDG